MLMLTKYTCPVCGESEMVHEAPNTLDHIRTHCDTEMVALQPVVICRRIFPERIAFSDETAPWLSRELKQALAGDQLQIYKITRHDWPETPILAGYYPHQQILILFYNRKSERACEIPNLLVGLDWWVKQPEIWKKHQIE
jgi:hypothetical protein